MELEAKEPAQEVGTRWASSWNTLFRLIRVL